MTCNIQLGLPLPAIGLPSDIEMIHVKLMVH